MKTINQLEAGTTVVGFFLAKSATFKSTNNQKPYLDLILSDKTGEISAKVWDLPDDIEEIFPERTTPLIKIKAVVTEWQGKLQLKVERIRSVQPEDGVQLEDYVQTAPIDSEQMLGTIKQYVQSISNGDIQKLVAFILEDVAERLAYYPAAKRNHHSVRGGLLYHILTMLRCGEALANIYPHINRDLLYAGIILHDIAKIDEMDADELGIVSDYTVEGHLLGHIVQGVKRVEQAAKELDIDREVSLLIQHMIISHHSQPEFGSPKPPMIPEAELLHHIDMIDSRMYDMHKALDTTAEGQSFSEPVWSLNHRRIYKSNIGM